METRGTDESYVFNLCCAAKKVNLSRDCFFFCHLKKSFHFEHPEKKPTNKHVTIEGGGLALRVNALNFKIETFIESVSLFAKLWFKYKRKPPGF
jgi:hypothetical protein